jgi:hypothetical protein
MDQRQRAAEALEALLADGEWHKAEEVRPLVQRLAGNCHRRTVNRAKLRVGVEVRKRPGTMGNADWRLRPAGRTSGDGA